MQITYLAHREISINLHYYYFINCYPHHQDSYTELHTQNRD